MSLPSTMSSEAPASSTGFDNGEKEMEELREFKKKNSLEEEKSKKTEEERLEKKRVKQTKYILSII